MSLVTVTFMAKLTLWNELSINYISYLHINCECKVAKINCPNRQINLINSITPRKYKTKKIKIKAEPLVQYSSLSL